MTLDEAKDSMSREVRYDAFPGADPEFGIITSVNGHGTIFVRYDGDRHSKSTRLEDLTLTQSNELR